MQHQQVLVAADHDPCLRAQCQRKKFVIQRIATARINSLVVSVFDGKQPRPPANQRNEGSPLRFGQIPVKLSSAENPVQFIERFHANAQVPTRERLMQSLVRN